MTIDAIKAKPAMVRIREILMCSPDERSLNDIPFLLKAFFRMRLLALNSMGGTSASEIELQQKFDELMR